MQLIYFDLNMYFNLSISIYEKHLTENKLPKTILSTCKYFFFLIEDVKK